MYDQEAISKMLATPQGLRALSAIKLDDSQTAAAQALKPTFQRGNPVNTFGGQTQAAVSTMDTGVLQPFTIQYTAPTGAAGTGKWLIVGNPGGLVSGSLSIADADIADYSGTSSTNSYGELQEYARGGFTIASLNYQVSDSAQYAQAVIVATRSLDGSAAKKQLNGLIVSSLNPMNNLSNVRILDLNGGQVLINRDTALLIFVGQGVTVTLGISAGGVRS